MLLSVVYIKPMLNGPGILIMLVVLDLGKLDLRMLAFNNTICYSLWLLVGLGHNLLVKRHPFARRSRGSYGGGFSFWFSNIIGLVARPIPHKRASSHLVLGCWLCVVDRMLSHWCLHAYNAKIAAERIVQSGTMNIAIVNMGRKPGLLEPAIVKLRLCDVYAVSWTYYIICIYSNRGYMGL